MLEIKCNKIVCMQQPMKQSLELFILLNVGFLSTSDPYNGIMEYEVYKSKLAVVFQRCLGLSHKALTLRTPRVLVPLSDTKGRGSG